MAQMKDLKGKTALITGASSGIGLEFAKQLSALGTNLVLSARREERLKEIAQDIKNRHGEGIKIEIIPGDLTEPGTPGELFKQINDKNIEVDILINNAGFGHVCMFEEEPFEMTYNMNMLNMVSLASMCHLFIPPMLRRKEGGVINIASTAGMQPLPLMANYAATKAYVLNLSTALWEEFRERGIVVMALCPGNTRSGFQETANMPEKVLRAFTLIEADEVVAEAIGAFMDGEPMYIPKAHRNFLQMSLSKFIPLKTKLKITASYYK